jgi:hypothetical protein
MAYAQCFNHDVFVSYTHDDNIPDREGDRGWVDEFERRLSIKLLRRCGEQPDVWRDRRLMRAQMFDQTLETAITESAVFLSLLSPRYLKSEYCQKELKWFCERGHQESQARSVDDFSRVFPVLLYNIPHHEWPIGCRGTLAFRFHDDDDFGEPLPVDSAQFESQLRSLVGELYTVLSRLRQQTLEQTDAASNAISDRTRNFKLFLACTADHLRPTRNRSLAPKLKEQGIELLEDVPPPFEEDSHADAVQRAMQAAQLSVHLLGTQPGEPLGSNDQGKTYPVEQVRIGLEHSASQLILLPEGFDADEIDNPSYARFLEQLRKEPREADRLELIQSGCHEMLDHILEKKRKLEQRAMAVKPGDGARGGVAFIDAHVNDVNYAFDLVSYLGRHRLTPVVIPEMDLTPKVTMSLFEENLKRSQLFIVVFGAVARYWVEHRLNEALKLILSNQLLTQIGVYVAPPEKSRQDVSFPPFFETMLNTHGFNPHTLAPLLKKVGVE